MPTPTARRSGPPISGMRSLSVYLDRSCTSRGLGRRLYGALIDILRLQGIRTVYGCVTVPNEKSEGLHQALGFRRLGTYRSTGYKCGALAGCGLV